MCSYNLQFRLVAEWLTETAFWEIAAYSVAHMFSLYFEYLQQVFPVLVLRAGFGFWLLKFLVFVYFLLSVFH